MTYNWKQYQEAKKIVEAFQKERQQIRIKRYENSVMFYGYAETKEEKKQILYKTIWGKRENISDAINVAKRFFPEDLEDDLMLKTLKNELIGLRKEYFNIRKKEKNFFNLKTI